MIIFRTCSLLSINPETCMIDSLNIGDSGFIVLRKVDNKMEEILHSEELVHSFNVPFQIGTNGDDIKKCQHASHVLFSGDIVVLATDGLWDNVYTEEIVKIVYGGLPDYPSEKNLSDLADKLAKLAQENAKNA